MRYVACWLSSNIAYTTFWRMKLSYSSKRGFCEKEKGLMIIDNKVFIHGSSIFHKIKCMRKIEILSL